MAFISARIRLTSFEVFPLLSLAKETLRLGGCYGAALNGANEEAVAMFVSGQISMPELFRVVEKATLESGNSDESLEAVFEADKKARSCVLRSVNKTI